ncbi:thiosulfate dehydrogenase [quinone] large subunit [Burkholderiaceae bacterium]|nr:thiosulfate dehydrogenase [quinone] large subunit [Burkholderiaceae bacterium]
MAATSTTGASEDLGKLLLRVALGVLILLHGIAKLRGSPDFIIDLVSKAGLPGALGYLVYVGEVLAPILLIVGLFTRAAALIVAINMVVAVALVHMGELASLTKNGGWALELQGMFFFTAIAVALLGAGRYSVGGLAGRWN